MAAKVPWHNGTTKNNGIGALEIRTPAGDLGNPSIRKEYDGIWGSAAP